MAGEDGKLKFLPRHLQRSHPAASQNKSKRRVTVEEEHPADEESDRRSVFDRLGPGGSQRNETKKPCFEFQQHGKCHMGKACLYSHISKDRSKRDGNKSPDNLRLTFKGEKDKENKVRSQVVVRKTDADSDAETEDESDSLSIDNLKLKRQEIQRALIALEQGEEVVAEPKKSDSSDLDSSPERPQKKKKDKPRKKEKKKHKKETAEKEQFADKPKDGKRRHDVDDDEVVPHKKHKKKNKEKKHVDESPPPLAVPEAQAKQKKASQVKGGKAAADLYDPASPTSVARPGSPDDHYMSSSPKVKGKNKKKKKKHMKSQAQAASKSKKLLSPLRKVFKKKGPDSLDSSKRSRSLSRSTPPRKRSRSMSSSSASSTSISQVRKRKSVPGGGRSRARNKSKSLEIKKKGHSTRPSTSSSSSASSSSSVSSDADRGHRRMKRVSHLHVRSGSQTTKGHSPPATVMRKDKGWKRKRGASIESWGRNKDRDIDRKTGGRHSMDRGREKVRDKKEDRETHRPHSSHVVKEARQEYREKRRDLKDGKPDKDVGRPAAGRRDAKDTGKDRTDRRDENREKEGARGDHRDNSLNKERNKDRRAGSLDRDREDRNRRGAGFAATHAQQAERGSRFARGAGDDDRDRDRRHFEEGPARFPPTDGQRMGQFPGDRDRPRTGFDRGQGRGGDNPGRDGRDWDERGRREGDTFRDDWQGGRDSRAGFAAYEAGREDRRGAVREERLGALREDRLGAVREDRLGAVREDRLGAVREDRLGAVREDRLGAVREDRLGAMREDRLGAVREDRLGAVREDRLGAVREDRLLPHLSGWSESGKATVLDRNQRGPGFRDDYGNRDNNERRDWKQRESSQESATQKRSGELDFGRGGRDQPAGDGRLKNASKPTNEVSGKVSGRDNRAKITEKADSSATKVKPEAIKEESPMARDEPSLASLFSQTETVPIKKKATKSFGGKKSPKKPGEDSKPSDKAKPGLVNRLVVRGKKLPDIQDLLTPAVDTSAADRDTDKAAEKAGGKKSDAKGKSRSLSPKGSQKSGESHHSQSRSSRRSSKSPVAKPPPEVQRSPRKASRSPAPASRERDRGKIEKAKPSDRGRKRERSRSHSGSESRHSSRSGGGESKRRAASTDSESLPAKLDGGDIAAAMLGDSIDDGQQDVFSEWSDDDEAFRNIIDGNHKNQVEDLDHLDNHDFERSGHSRYNPVSAGRYGDVRDARVENELRPFVEAVTDQPVLEKSMPNVKIVEDIQKETPAKEKRGRKPDDEGYEEISSDENELDEEGEKVNKRTIVSILAIDMASLMSTPKLKPAQGPVFERYRAASLFAEMGLSRTYAGDQLYRQVQEVCQRELAGPGHSPENTGDTKLDAEELSCTSVISDDPATPSADLKSHVEAGPLVSTCSPSSLSCSNVLATSTKEDNTAEEEPSPMSQKKMPFKRSFDPSRLLRTSVTGASRPTFTLYGDTSAYHKLNRARAQQRAGLLANFGVFRRALTARKDLDIRRRLCGIDPKYDQSAVYPSGAVDADTFRQCLQLFKQNKPSVLSPCGS